MNPGTQRLLLHQVHIARRSESAKRHFFNRVTVWHGIRWQSVHADQLCRNLGTIHQTCSVVVGHRSARLGEMLKPSGEIKYRVLGVQRDCWRVVIFQAALKHRAERVQMLLNYANAFPKVQIEQVKPAAIERRNRISSRWLKFDHRLVFSEGTTTCQVLGVFTVWSAFARTAAES